MDIQEIKSFLERELKENHIMELWDLSCVDYPINASDDKYLIGKLIGIFSEFRNPINQDDSLCAGGYYFSLKYKNEGNHLGQFQFLIDNESKDQGVLSRIKVLGNNGFNLTSRWNVCAKRSSSFYSFGVSQNIDLFPPSIAIPKFNLNDEGNTESPKLKNVIIVIIEIANPLVAYEKLEESYQHVLLTNKTLFDDVEILIKTDGAGASRTATETLMAHKAILTGRSSVFRDMFNSTMIEGRTSQFKVPDTEAGVFKEFLKYLYTGDADLKTYAADLYIYADKYNVAELMDLSEKYIAENIQNVGWMTVFQLCGTDAYKKGLKLLRHSLRKYYGKNKIALKKSGEFQSAGKLYPAVFYGLYFP